ncbi:hypothetical protein JRG18_12100 [Kocuria palustris]|jgi:di/tricarboxylate transporter|uniref:SLC13 family permease n=1 Tax=Kocuria palustris TaxID=71999 RepID=UPI0019D0E094|nr:SLC13 family permease [Kocuria palustris]MBN6754258.1 hypothetical protein [Kocuria palustris]MBN6759196.1 hypothetical protein [Kocuria palustris]MBN6764236.1 hypothetical protein [Kocuria palustris]MBN6783737.1 hypothetical protein [Kocuria palustris]MBN6800219.1 hypothetical protein [Kocuria palustris]
MTPEVVSILVLALLFLIATVRSVNMGVLAFVAAFAVGVPVAGMTSDDVMAGFPGELFLVLMGLTFLFGFAQHNGSIDLLVQWSLRVVRGRVAAAPWIFFGLAAVLISFGALFAVAVVAPLAIPFARKYGINQLMMGMMVVHGALAGAFSPISVYGAFINSYLAEAGLPTSPLALFFVPMVFNTVIATIVYLTMGGRRLKGLRLSGNGDALPTGGPHGGSMPSTSAPSGGLTTAGGGVALKAPPAPVTGPSAVVERATAYQKLTLVGLAALALGTAVFGFDVGVLSLSIASVLAIVSPKGAKQAMNTVSWSTVILVAGVLTYVNVLETAGTIEYVSAGIMSIGIPLVAALLLCYLAGITSAMASSVGIIGVAIALAVPFLQSGAIDPIGFVVALAIAATVVDVSPFSTNGALVLANAAEEDRDKYYRQMLLYAGIVVAVGPGLAWLTVLVPGWF